MELQRPKAIVVGADGGIGSAVVTALQQGKQYSVHSVSRSRAGSFGSDVSHWCSDYSEESITSVARALAETPGEIARLIITNGILQTEGVRPERALKRIRRGAMLEVFAINSVLPMLWLAALDQPLREASAPRIAALSARVGSIADNGLGGWYSYRASKSALNMMLKCAAIEFQRSNPRAKLVAFHPGTTDTPLSEPFQKGVPEEKLFSPEFVAGQLLGVLDSVTPDGKLDYLDWAGKPIPW